MDRLSISFWDLGKEELKNQEIISEMKRFRSEGKFGTYKQEGDCWPTADFFQGKAIFAVVLYTSEHTLKV